MPKRIPGTASWSCQGGVLFRDKLPTGGVPGSLVEFGIEDGSIRGDAGEKLECFVRFVFGKQTKMGSTKVYFGRKTI